jgi:N,N'-diacetyllegionaminate synthase
MKAVRFGEKMVGAEHPPYVIAEACVNHQGDFEHAKKMVVFAHAMGADAIKFQMHILEDEMLREVPVSQNFDKPLWNTIEDTNFSTEQHAELISFCSKVGIQYLCTPFSKKSADVLQELGVVAFKTGSGELTNIPLMRHIGAKGKPMIVSTGMSTIEEITRTVETLKDLNVPLVLTHCVSAYPCPYERVNLGMVPRLAQLFDVPVGLSDHSRGIYTAVASVALGACILEKHFTFDRTLPGPDHKSSIEGYELGELVKGARAVFLARGAEREIFPEEREIVAWAREGVVSVVPISKGSKITADMVTVKRPTPGPDAFPADQLDFVIGKKAAVDIASDRQILRTQIQ